MAGVKYRVLRGSVVVGGVPHLPDEVVTLDAAEGDPLCDGPRPVLARAGSARAATRKSAARKKTAAKQEAP